MRHATRHSHCTIAAANCIETGRADGRNGGGELEQGERGRIIRRPFVNLRASVRERGRDARVRSPFCRSYPRIEMLSA